jgi:hypothetical protein
MTLSLTVRSKKRKWGYEMDEQRLAELFDDMLDETNPEVVIGGLTYLPSQVLKEVDPIAYRVGMSEYEDYLNEEE